MTEALYKQWIHNTSDGYPIVCHEWSPPEGLTPKAKIMILHGIQSHAGWYQNLAKTLAFKGIEVLMPDRRGSGQNKLDRGHAQNSGRLIQDIDEIRRAWLRSQVDPSIIKPAIAGISWGGKLAAAAVVAHPDAFEGLALIAPGLFAQVRPPFLTQLKIAFCAIFSPKTLFEIPLSNPALFTDQAGWQDFIATDPQTLHYATARFFIVSRSLDLQLNHFRKRILVPLLLQIAGCDRIIRNVKTIEYFQKIKSLKKFLIEYPKAHHTLEFEPAPTSNQYAEDLAEWLLGNLSTKNSD